MPDAEEGIILLTLAEREPPERPPVVGAGARGGRQERGDSSPPEPDSHLSRSEVMAWGPQSETKYERRDLTKEQVTTLPETETGLKDEFEAFAGTYKDGDEVYYESESNNHRGYQRYVGRRGSFTYCVVVSTFMS